MKRITLPLLSSLLLLATSLSAQQLSTATSSDSWRSRLSGQMIVRPVQEEVWLAAGLSDEEARRRRQAAIALLDGQVVRHYRAVDEFIARVPAGLDEEAWAAQLLPTGLFQYAHPDPYVFPARIPNDPDFPSQWHHVRIGSAAAWDHAIGNRGVKVAVVDTGIDLAHPDISPQLIGGYNAYNQLQQNAGGRVDDEDTIHGPGGHGTRVAGVIGAVGNNSLNVAGVCWDVSLMPVRITSGNFNDPPPTLSVALHGARWAADHDADIVNVSFENVRPASVETTGAYVRSQGGLLVWSVGNGGTNYGSQFDHPNVLVVGAVDDFDNRPGFTNYGDAVDMVAPGTNVWSTRRGQNGGNANGADGTSFAAAIVSGAAALLLDANPALQSWEIEQILLDTAVDLGSPPEFGEGRLALDTATTKAASLMQLSVSPLSAGAQGQATIEGARPGATVYVGYSVVGLGPFPIPGLGVTLGILNPGLIGIVIADPFGGATLWGSVPSSAPGLNLWVQAAQHGGLSNIVSTSVQ